MNFGPSCSNAVGIPAAREGGPLDKQMIIPKAEERGRLTELVYSQPAGNLCGDPGASLVGPQKEQ